MAQQLVAICKKLNEKVFGLSRVGYAAPNK